MTFTSNHICEGSTQVALTFRGGLGRCKPFLQFGNPNCGGVSALISGGKQMKRIALLLALVLGSVMLSAQEESQGTEMTGTICDSKCVTHTRGQSACDLNCGKTGGDAVFVEDNGKVTKIANPDKVKGYMGKHVKTKSKMMKDLDTMWIYSIYG